MLLRGAADVALGGVMRSYVLADQPVPQYLLSIAEVNSRDGFLLLSRTPVPGFSWKDLEGKRLILFAEAPTPWMCLQDVLRRHGVGIEKIQVIKGLAVSEAISTLLAGGADYLETGQPMAEELLADGQAYLAAAMAGPVGPLPYSSLLVAPDFRHAKPDLCASVVRGLARAQRWMAASPPAAIAELVAPDFPAVPRPLLDTVIARFQAAGTWPDRPGQPREPYERMGRILVAGGLIRRAAPFEKLCDDSFAQAVEARR
jgi:NitT/TauT family transport system substrate-binding protein